MLDLREFVSEFEDRFPRYRDSSYDKIVTLVSTLPKLHSQLSDLTPEQKIVIREYLTAFAAIRNYKAQIEFPDDIISTNEMILRILESKQGEDLENSDLQTVFFNLLSVDGLALATISAIFHFCQPVRFPIVDKYVALAVRSLFDEKQLDVPKSLVPSMPKSADPEDTLYQYLLFISVLTQVRDQHNSQYGTSWHFRELDKGLMVYGEGRYSP